MQCNYSCSQTSECYFKWKTRPYNFCYELRIIRKGTSERRGTGELCSIIIVDSRPKDVFIVSALGWRNATS